MHELTIHLKTHSGTPLYEQIYSYIKENIREGKIVCGEKLPSTRSLCSYLEVSRSTVELAYGQLLSEGYIESVPCRGFFVAQVDDLLHLEAAPAREQREKRGEEREAGLPVRLLAKRRGSAQLPLQRVAQALPGGALGRQNGALPAGGSEGGVRVPQRHLPLISTRPEA